MNIRDSCAVGVVFRPPNGGVACCKSFSADLRVTGNCASAARLLISPAVTPPKMSAQPGACMARVSSAGNADNSACSRAAGSRDSSES